jgi:hypothetical protein
MWPSPPAEETDLPATVSAADDLSSVGTSTLADLDASLAIAYSNGLISAPPGNLAEAQGYINNGGQGASGAAAATFFVPPAAAALGVSSGAMGILSGVASFAANAISALPCT